MDGDHRLRIILEDEENRITKYVIGREKYWNGQAKELYEEGKINLCIML